MLYRELNVVQQDRLGVHDIHGWMCVRFIWVFFKARWREKTRSKTKITRERAKKKKKTNNLQIQREKNPNILVFGFKKKKNNLLPSEGGSRSDLDRMRGEGTLRFKLMSS